MSDPSRPTLRSERVLLRPVRAEDEDRVVAVLREPDVARWWLVEPRGAERVWRDLLEPEDAVTFAVEWEGKVVGCVQYYEETDPDYRRAGMDIFLSSASEGRGLGSEVLRVLARFLFDERGHHRLVIDPAAANERAIRAYERIGFRPVGVMRRYERGADGWHDSLLMDLLAEELR